MTNEDFKRFDMKKAPIRQRKYLQPIVWALSFPDVKKHETVINKIGTEGLKPPYIMLNNHNAFFDFKVASKAVYPNRANYIVAIDGFIKREWLLRNVGGICKRKFTNDITLVRNIKKVLDNGDICMIYPEARYSLCGTTAILPDALGKLCKIMHVPVVTLICHGNHIDQPFWNLRKRNIKGNTADFKLLFSKEELEKASVDEINNAIKKEFVYDEYTWQKENNIHVTAPWRAEGLDKVLYKCPACGTEYQMKSKGAILYCDHCHKEWEMSELGELKATQGVTEFSHIPSWYEWERSEVRKEVEAGTYHLECACHTDSLPNAKGYIDLGKGTLVHDMSGFHLKGSGKYGDYSMEKSVESLYSCHIEYNYLGKFGDCIDLNTLEDTFYIYPEGNEFSVTKIALATEELYDYKKKQK